MCCATARRTANWAATTSITSTRNASPATTRSGSPPSATRSPSRNRRPERDPNPIYVGSPLGFYDGLPFHRIQRSFMAQSGDPGSGGPGYEFPGEFDSSLKHDDPGMLSNASQGGKPALDGSQFFVS